MGDLLHALVNFMTSHPGLVLSVLIGWWVLSATVRALPIPGPNDSRRYVFLFNLAHNLRDSAAGALAHAIAARQALKAPESKAIDIQALAVR